MHEEAIGYVASSCSSYKLSLPILSHYEAYGSILIAFTYSFDYRREVGSKIAYGATFLLADSLPNPRAVDGRVEPLG